LGQKTHPTGFRLGVIKTWDSRWYAKKEYPELLKEDIFIRRYIKNRLQRAMISKVVIERAPKKVTITIHTARPGIVIGRKGAEVDQLRDELRHLTGGDVYINIQEIKRPEIDAALVGEQVANQLRQRMGFRRVMKKAAQQSMRMGAGGVRIRLSGRLGGAEMGRTEEVRMGRVPLHTLRADIDFARVTSHTSHGTIGVKVWVFTKEIYDRAELERQAEAQAARLRKDRSHAHAQAGQAPQGASRSS
jgi:small subunit ribosomal protein S3